jgi:hypothetical protein
MKRRAQCVVFLLVVLAMTPPCFAAQQLKLKNDESKICENYYVPTGGVYVSPSGIFVSLEGQLVEVSMLCTDAKGVFVPGEEMNRQFVWCPICQRWYDPDRPHNCK